MFFSAVVVDGASMLLMHPEMQFGRIAFSSFCPRATFHTAQVNRDRRKPTAPRALCPESGSNSRALVSSRMIRPRRRQCVNRLYVQVY
jgi:hypothetical protein